MDGAAPAAVAAAPIRTTCPYCGVGCGILASPAPGAVAGGAMGQGRGLGVKGDGAHPANFGRLCSKGSALGETVGLDGRLLAPRIGGAEATWDAALDLVARRFQETIRRHGPDSVAFYVSGQLLTEDYYAANKLMKGFIGAANIDTNSRLCMASSVAGHRRAFGTDTVPGVYEDLEQADLVVLVGSNLAWCHPVIYQRLVAAKAARPSLRVVVVDPRRTASCDIADLHLPIASGSDAALFNAVLAGIGAAGAADPAFLAHVAGHDAALAAARASDPSQTGLSPAVLAEFVAMWVATEKVVTVYSQGINQSESGTDKVNAIINCHLATGRIGRAGMGPFSVTGQPNAMGGREVGGMANMLACHLDIGNAAHRTAVQRFWASPAMAAGPGLKAVDMFRAVEDGRIKALWIICTNPAVSMPDADRVAQAIAGCDFVVVSDMIAETDTTRLADVLLPATGWGEKDGTVTNSERRISRQRALFAPPAGARHDWQIIADVAGRMGWADHFDWDGPAAIYREHAALSGVAAGLGSDFDISAHADLSDDEYARLQPFLWPLPAPGRPVRTAAGRFFGTGAFHTADGRAQMVAVSPRAPAARPDAAYPFRLNTGRVRDHWHTMTRTGLAPRLNQHIAEPFLEVHPDDAAALGLHAAGLAQARSPQGRAVLRVLITDRVRRGEVFAPMHWTGETAPAGRIDALVAAVTDPISGQPESKASVVALAPFAAAWHGFAVSASPFRPDCAYWARARTSRGMRAELAGESLPADWESYARQLFALPDADLQLASDARRGMVRLALSVGGRVQAALFAGPEPVALARGHVADLPGSDAGPGVLAGWPGADRPDPGAIVCACFDVGVNTILAAIEMQHLASVEAIGDAVRAGTNCGSCRPELRALLARASLRAAAE